MHLGPRRGRTAVATSPPTSRVAAECRHASPGNLSEEQATSADMPAPEAVTPPGRVSNYQMVRNFANQAIFRALGMAASFGTVAITTRHLGASSYGALTTAVMFVALWTSLTELGIGSVIVRRVMSGRGDLERLVRVNAGLSMTYCLPLFGVTAVSGAFVYRDDPEIVAMIAIVSTGLILTTISSCLEPVFLVTVRFGAVALSDLASRIGTLCATVVLVQLHSATVFFALVQLVPPMVVFTIQGVAAARIINWRPVISLAESWNLIKEALPLTGVLIIGVLYWRVDGVILSLRSTTEQVGIYGLAYALTFALSALSTFFHSTTLSAMIHASERNRAQLAHFTAKAVQWMLFAGAPIAVVGAILAKSIVELGGSSEFVEHGGPTVAILSFAVALTFLTGTLSQALFAAHDQVFLLRVNVVNLLINISLNILLAQPYGAVGAATALVLTEAIGVLIASWRLSHLAGYRTPWSYLARLSLPLLTCAAVAYVMREAPVLLTIPVAAVVYISINVTIGPTALSTIKSALSKTTETEENEILHARKAD